MKETLIYILLILMPSFVIRAQTLSLNAGNPHYLFYKGKPFIIVTSAEHYGAVLNTGFDFEAYLKTLKDEGMNYTRIFSGAYVEIPGSFGIKNNSLAPEEGKFLAPWKRVSEPGLYKNENKFDLNSWDAEYFTRLKSFIARAAENDIIVEFTFFCATYQDSYWLRHPFNPGNNINKLTNFDRKLSNTIDNGNLLNYQLAFVKKITTELNAFDNLLYEIQNEPWADDPQKAMRVLRTLDPQGMGWAKWSETASGASLRWQKLVAETITETEKALPKKHLIAQNYVNFKHSLEEVGENISILNFHYAWPEAVWLNYGWNKPVSFDESGFAGSSDTTYLRQAWQFMLAGGSIFNNLDYSFYAGAETGKGTNTAPGGGSTELRKQLYFLRSFLESFNFTLMRPDFEVVEHSPGLEWQAISEKGKQYAIVFSGTRASSIRVILPKGKYAYSFISPYSGKVLSEGSVSSTGKSLELTFPEPADLLVMKILAK